MAFDVREIARLDAEVREHKRAARRHREQARLAAQRRDALLAFARAHGIPVIKQGEAEERHGHE